MRGRRRPCTRAADRSILTIAGWPKRKFQLKAVQAWQHDIEDHKVVTILDSPPQATPSFVFTVKVEALLFEKLLQENAQLHVVIDQQYLHYLECSREDKCGP